MVPLWVLTYPEKDILAINFFLEGVSTHKLYKKFNLAERKKQVICKILKTKKKRKKTNPKLFLILFRENLIAL